MDVRNREALERKITYMDFLSLLIEDEIERRMSTGTYSAH